MPKLSLSVPIAAGSLCALSLVHVLFWAYAAITSREAYADTYPYTLLFPVAFAFSVLGLAGIFVGVGIFRARGWARIAALVLAALVGFFCAFAMLVVAGLRFIAASSPELSLDRSDSRILSLIYLVILLIAVWWIFLFSRQEVAAQFSRGSASTELPTIKRASCPPPIALLAWLMIISGGLSAISWPLILGKIPAMLFTHVFSFGASKWIWIFNILLFLACGVGLLKLQRWSYDGAIFLHVFWLASLFVSQISPNYERYLSTCIAALQADETIGFLHFKSPQWIAALTTAIPTALLIAGLFYYRRSFLQAVADSRHLPS
ncbi:MAG: hypothetical protein NVS9B14_06140 [Candidatus Acidiferrum sp.]